MSEPPWLNEPEQLVWQDVVRLTRRIYSALAKDMLESSGLSGADFEILVALTDHAGARRRAKDLALDLEWGKSRLSHQIKRMEARGVVVREECATDKRGTYVAVTDLGQQLLAQAAPQHVALVRTLVIDALSPDDLATLGELTAKLLARSEPVST